MWVLSQSKEVLMEVSTFEIYPKGRKHIILGYNNNEKSYELAEYNSLDGAREELYKLLRHIESKDNYIYYMGETI